MTPTSPATPAAAPVTSLRRALVRACRADVEAFKPGNVAIGMPAHRMTAEDFLRSAEAVVGPLSDPQLRLGERIEAAVAATARAVGCNTNLGIVLLLAPMATAASRAAIDGRPPSAWRAYLPHVLAATDRADGAAAARAIVLAHPAGLGAAPEADVGDADPSGSGFRHTLLEAMALAAGRDQIARQYVTGFATVASMADRLTALRSAGATREDAVTAVFLEQLAIEPDTHIERKHGSEKARAVAQASLALRRQIPDPPGWSTLHIQQLADFHHLLRSGKTNPGTSADLAVAAVFATELDAMQNF